MNIPNEIYALNNMSINPTTKVGKVIRIKALEKGYYPTAQTATQEDVDAINLEAGVDKATAMAMEDASVFGWDCYLGTLASHQKRIAEQVTS